MFTGTQLQNSISMNNAPAPIGPTAPGETVDTGPFPLDKLPDVTVISKPKQKSPGATPKSKAGVYIAAATGAIILILLLTRFLKK